MKWLKKFFSWFKPGSVVESGPDQNDNTDVLQDYPENYAEFYLDNNFTPSEHIPAVDIMKCSDSCVGLECSHHFDPNRLVDKVLIDSGGEEFIVQGKYNLAPPYYVEKPSISAKDIWKNSGPVMASIPKDHEVVYTRDDGMFITRPQVRDERRDSRYAVAGLSDSPKGGEPIWVEGKDPYLIGGVPDEVAVPPGKKYTALGNGLIDDPQFNIVKVNKIEEFTQVRNTLNSQVSQEPFIDDFKETPIEPLPDELFLLDGLEEFDATVYIDSQENIEKVTAEEIEGENPFRDSI